MKDDPREPDPPHAHCPAGPVTPGGGGRAPGAEGLPMPAGKDRPAANLKHFGRK